MVPCGGDCHGNLLVDAFNAVESSEAVEVTILTGCDFEYSGRVSKRGSIRVSINVLGVTCLVGVVMIIVLCLLVGV